MIELSSKKELKKELEKELKKTQKCNQNSSGVVTIVHGRLLWLFFVDKKQAQKQVEKHCKKNAKKPFVKHPYRSFDTLIHAVVLIQYRRSSLPRPNISSSALYNI